MFKKKGFALKKKPHNWDFRLYNEEYETDYLREFKKKKIDADDDYAYGDGGAVTKEVRAVQRESSGTHPELES